MNIKGADKPAPMCRLICAFVVHMQMNQGFSRQVSFCVRYLKGDLKGDLNALTHFSIANDDRAIWG